MSFISKSANYSETQYFKSKYLKPICENIISTIRNSKNTKSNFYKDRTENGEQDDEVYIPNNNKKYFMFMINKKIVSNCDNNWNLLYFFPCEQTLEFYKNDKLNQHLISDFYVETDVKFNNIKCGLFEGYLYNSSSYLITDVLYIDSLQTNILSLDYSARNTFINELFIDKKDFSVKNINNSINIGIHQFFSKSSKNMINIFKNNFIYKDEICCLEKVSKTSFHKTTFIEPQNKKINKLIEKSERFSDVYNVYHEKTQNNDGILYIKGIKESKIMRELFKKNKQQKILCIWNNNFNKWQPILE